MIYTRSKRFELLIIDLKSMVLPLNYNLIIIIIGKIYLTYNIFISWGPPRAGLKVGTPGGYIKINILLLIY